MSRVYVFDVFLENDQEALLVPFRVPELIAKIVTRFVPNSDYAPTKEGL